MNQFELPVNEEKVIDRVIDVYLWLDDFNTEEVKRLAHHLMNLANRRATDVELAYQNRWPEECYPTLEELTSCYYETI